MSESLENPDLSTKKVSLHSIVGLLTACLCLILSLLLVAYIYNHRSLPINIPDPSPVPPVVTEEIVPTGSILLTLSPLDGNNTGIYQFNFSDLSLTPYYEKPNGLAVTGKFEDGNNSRLFISEYLENDTLQIVAISPVTKEREVLTNSPTKLKRYPLWSSYYEVLLYSARPELGEVLASPDEFSVYIANKDGSEKELTKGSFPVLTPDGKSVVVLRNNGLNKVDIFGTSTEKIWGYDSGDGLTNQMFNISPNGQYIAWNFPDQGKIYVAHVTSWEPFKFQLRFVIESHAFWPIFSPDSKYLAFEEVDWTNPPSKPRLVVVDLNSPTLERKLTYDLSEYNQTKMFISDWQ